MTGNFDCDLAYLTHLRSEHRRIRDDILAIEHKWDVVHRAGPTPVAVHEIVDRLGALRADLAYHFTEEEEGGCLEEAVSREPSLNADAKRLLQEHKRILEYVDDLVGRLKTLLEPQETTDEIEVDFQRFATMLQVHEEQENHLLEVCFGIELD